MGVVTAWLASTDQAITQGFGVCELAGDCPHTGIDVGAPAGTPIVDQIAGVVQDIVDAGGFGMHQVLDIGGGRQILLGHESEFAVPSGTSVVPGEVIGYVGSTGFSTGPHLHFEEDINGRPVDPSQLLTGRGGPGDQGSVAQLNPVQRAQQVISGLNPLNSTAAALTVLPTQIGHGLADATSATIHNAGVWARNQVVPLMVALIVVIVLFVR